MPDSIFLLGQGGGNKIFQGGVGYQDDGVAYVSRGRSNRVAPAGVKGEAVFTGVFFSITHTMAVTLKIVPVVDDVALNTLFPDTYPVELVLLAKPERTMERFLLALSIPMRDSAGVDRGKAYPRGCWFQLLVYDGGLAAGDLVYEVDEVEYQIVRQTAQIVPAS